MYAWLVFLHIIGLFAFLLAHGASAGAAFALRSEQDPQRMRALLMMSANTYRLMYPSLLVIVLSGIAAGFQGRWWSFGWIWLSLVLLIALIASMSAMGSKQYNAARKAAGLPYFDKGKINPPVPPGSTEEIRASINRVNPLLLTLLGYGGLGLIAWLMIFKPF